MPKVRPMKMQDITGQDEEEEETQVEKPAETITTNDKGPKEYYYVKTVKSLEEFDKYRFKDNCITSRKMLHAFKKSLITYCTRKRNKKRCDFELMAVRPELGNDTIHLYAHSQHNHPLISEEKRSFFKTTDFMPDANPLAIFRTPENIEWTFLQTVPDYDKLQKFRAENRTGMNGSKNYAKWGRIRLHCTSKSSYNCPFMLLALKTTTDGYHVYKHGQHKHNKDPDLTKKEQSSSQKNLDEQKGEDDELEKEIAEQSLRKMTKSVLGKKKEYYYLKSVKTMGELDKFRIENNCRFYNGKPLRILKSSIMPCAKKIKEKTCNFELLALPSAKENGEIHVYGHSRHSNHPFTSGTNQKQISDLGQQNSNQQEMEDETGGKDDKQLEEDEEEEEKMEEGEEDEELLEQTNKYKEKGDEGEEEKIEDDDIIVLEDEEHQEKEEKEEGKIEIIEENAREETLEEKLAKANGKVYKWMAGIGPNEIEGTIGDWDKLSLLKMVEMADQEIRGHPKKLNLWLPWLKCAIPKCSPQIQGFNVRFKDLIKLTFN